MVVEQRNSLNTILRFTILHYFPPLLQTNKNESLFYTDGGRSWPALCSLSAPQPNPSWAFCSESLVIMFGHLLVYANQCGMIPLFVCLFTEAVWGHRDLQHHHAVIWWWTPEQQTCWQTSGSQCYACYCSEELTQSHGYAYAYTHAHTQTHTHTQTLTHKYRHTL